MFGNVGIVKLLLLLATVLQQGHSQITCNIEIDSNIGLWRETTPERGSASVAQYCTGYTYKETNLTCTTGQCQWNSTVNDACTLYYNANTQHPCLATCKKDCSHGHACKKECTCTQDNARYNKTKMCVPFKAVKECPTKQIDEKNKCVKRPSSDDTCPNGQVNAADGKCVPSECISGCVGGTCQTNGTCTCQDGSVTGPEQGYNCTARSADQDERIERRNSGRSMSNQCEGVTCSNGQCVEGQCTSIRCPDPNQAVYCQSQCQASGCTARGGGWCQQGECMCNWGFKKYSGNRYQCDMIVCPDRDQTNYCQVLCQASGCTAGGGGWCQQGVCMCNWGFKKSTLNPNQCDLIKCPASVWEDDAYCYTICNSRCKDGTCDNQGQCTCNEGFKKDRNNIYKCNQIQCPSEAEDDKRFCTSLCSQFCNNGSCRNGVHCECKTGFKKDAYQYYKCNQIICPSYAQEDNRYCKNKCTPFCTNGTCGLRGVCNCNEGFKKPTESSYQCDQIQCPSSVKEDNAYCNTQCTPLCTNGWCDVGGTCRCNTGFKKEPWYSLYQCYEVKCPASVKEDQAYCNTQCTPLCTNGWCDVGGICRCNTGFKKEPMYSLYQCNEVKCPASVETDNRYCKTKCIPLCTNGTCGIRGVCNCNEGFKRPTESGYHCDQIICPSSVKEDYAHCETQCKARCKDGTCDSQGRCTCEEGFTEVPDKEYTCITITCPSTVSKVRESRFCKRVCESQCLSGLCDDVGVCSCKDGFKKHRGASYNCVKILCPAWSVEDNEYCALQCKTSCTNGECNARGVCVCQEGFMATNITMNLDCQHKCNEDGSCSLTAILGGIFGVGFSIVIAIIVTAVLMIKKRNRKEREESEKAEVQDIPLDILPEEPEYSNYGQEAEMEDNTMYQTFDWQHGRRRPQ